MKAKERTSDAVQIMYDLFVSDDPARLADLERARRQAEIARTIYQMRTEAGLTQEELARLIGTKQSVISRLEDEEYEGRSLDILRRIAEALKYKVTLVMEPREPKRRGPRRLQLTLG